MEEIFYGDWSFFSENPQSQDVPYRVKIEGSDNNTDNIYYAENNITADVRGKEWRVYIDRRDFSGNWHPIKILKEISFTQSGLTKLLVVGDDINRDYTDVTDVRLGSQSDFEIQFTSLDPKLNPLYPIGQPFDLTFPKTNW